MAKRRRTAKQRANKPATSFTQVRELADLDGRPVSSACEHSDERCGCLVGGTAQTQVSKGNYEQDGLYVLVACTGGSVGENRLTTELHGDDVRFVVHHRARRLPSRSDESGGAPWWRGSLRLYAENPHDPPACSARMRGVRPIRGSSASVECIVDKDTLFLHRPSRDLRSWANLVERARRLVGNTGKVSLKPIRLLASARSQNEWIRGEVRVTSLKLRDLPLKISGQIHVSFYRCSSTTEHDEPDEGTNEEGDEVEPSEVMRPEQTESTEPGNATDEVIKQILERTDYIVGLASANISRSKTGQANAEELQKWLCKIVEEQQSLAEILRPRLGRQDFPKRGL